MGSIFNVEINVFGTFSFWANKHTECNVYVCIQYTLTLLFTSCHLNWVRSDRFRSSLTATIFMLQRVSSVARTAISIYNSLRLFFIGIFLKNEHFRCLIMSLKHCGCCCYFLIEKTCVCILSVFIFYMKWEYLIQVNTMKEKKSEIFYYQTLQQYLIWRYFIMEISILKGISI